MARKQKQTKRSAWDDPTIVVNKESPAYVKAAQGEKWKRRALYTVAFGVLPVMAIVGAGMVAQASSAPPQADPRSASAVTNDSEGKAEAFRALQEWIASKPSPLPGGQIVSWDGYTVEEPPAPAPDDANPTTYGFSFENHSFTVQRGETMWHAEVEVAVDDVVGATATATPALSPITRVDNVATANWFGLEPATPSQATSQAIAAWAAAYTGGDADALHQIIQDRNTERSYVPLTGVEELISVETIVAATLPGEDGEPQSDQIIARVQLRFWWEGGRPKLAPNEAEESPAPVTYDLLITHADTATPVVVAWGAAGEGPNLRPYQNAIDAVLTAPETPGSTDPAAGDGEQPVEDPTVADGTTEEATN